MTVRAPTPTTDVSRRTALGGLATAGGLAIGGTALLAHSSQPVRADITANTLTVADTTWRDDAATPAEIFLLVGGTIDWASDDVVPDGYEVDLELATTQADADAGNYDRIGRTDGRILTYDGSSEYAIRAPATAHVDLSADAVAAPEAGQVTTTGLWLRVVGKIQQGDEVLVETTATDQATLTVENSSVAIEAGVSGDGSIAVQGNASAATPTVA